MAPGSVTPPLTPRFILSTGLLVIATVLAVWYTTAAPVPELRRLDGPWRCSWDGGGNWQPWSAGKPPERGERSGILLATVVPSGLKGRQALFIPPYTAFQSFEVTLGERPLYRSGALPAGFADRHRYHLWHLIDLPDNAAGTPLVFRFSSHHPRTIGLDGPVWLGQPRELLQRFVLADLPLAILAALLLLAGAGSLVATRFFSAAARPQLFAFALTAFGSGCYLFSESALSPLLITPPVVGSYLHYLSFFLFIIGICRYFQPLTDGRDRTILTWCLRLFTAYPLLATGLDLSGLVSWDTSFSLALVMVMAVVCWFGTVVCSSRFSRAASGDAPLIRAAFIPLFVAGLFDAAVGLHLIAAGPLLYPWGLLVLVAVLFYRVLAHDREERMTARLLLEKARRDEENAIVEERQRIARDMHDGIAQELAMLQMRVSVWERLLLTDREKLSGEFSRFRVFLTGIIGEIRRVLFALRPLELEELGFDAAVRRLVEVFGQNSGVRFSLELPEPGTVPPALEAELYRIIQETLNNIVKHAEASEATIAIGETEDDRLRLLVRDNGRGFDPNDPRHRHRLGLRQMRERVERRHGHFSLESSPDGGTVITILMPTSPRY